MLMADPLKMVRTDGTKVALSRHPSWKVELYGLWLTLTKDPLIVLLFPMFFASNWFYTWREFPISLNRNYHTCTHIFALAHNGTSRIQRLQQRAVQHPCSLAQQLGVLALANDWLSLDRPFA